MYGVEQLGQTFNNHEISDKVNTVGVNVPEKGMLFHFSSFEILDWHPRYTGHIYCIHVKA